MRTGPVVLRGLCLALCGVVSGAEVTVVSDVRIYGGQHFFGGASSAVSGNANAVVTPAVKFNGRWSLVPTYTGEYRGTRDVQELAGGGTLFQDSTRHGFLVKGVRALGTTWKLKPSVGYAREWLRETKGEKWGDGLFNNQKMSGGLELEKAFSKDSGSRLAYDYYMLTFPNYQSLETSTDPSLARELAGKDVLDSKNHLVTWSGWTPFPGAARAEWGLTYNLRDFDDQKVVAQSGALTPALRADKALAVSAGLGSKPWRLGESVRMVGDLSVSYGVNKSNQNHYDARKAVFIGRYYDHAQTGIRPTVTAAVGETPWYVNAGVGVTERKYAERPTQDGAGDYLGAKTKVRTVTADLGLSYPYSRNFKIRVLTTLSWSHSNQAYEQIYRYNYRIANYLAGFSYEY